MERLAVDIGGTFVDAIRYDEDRELLVHKKSNTTPSEPAKGVMNAINKVDADLSDTGRFIHGTTLGINAILEREGAVTGIITNEGFRDVFEVGRFSRPREEMFNPLYERPASIVPRYRRFGVPGRMDSHGSVLEPVDEDEVTAAATELVEDHGVESVAIALLHSYQNAAHEQEVAAIIRELYPGVSFSISSNLTQEYREYERTCTAVLDAYIKPIFESYVDKLDDRLTDESFEGSFFITRSGGGAMAAGSAKDQPVNTVLSGPAGGIIGAASIGQTTGHDNLIAADIGGTSTDTCVISKGTPIIEHESTIGTHPVLTPTYDIRTIGSGGGSIAWLDGEFLKVGPKSAGADPGPICYGQGGTVPTVTDAAILLGYIDSENFLGGEMDLDLSAAEEGLHSELAEPLDRSLQEVCQGIFDVLTADISNAIREITVERGLDPREFSILAYGGAGPLIMPFVAREMDVEATLVPPVPAVFSAWGMLLSDVTYDFSQTYVTPLGETEIDEIKAVYRTLEEEAIGKLSGEGFDGSEQALFRSAEMRYIGQEHTVEIQMTGFDSISDLKARFNDRHESRYGHRTDDPVEIVHLRVRATGEMEKGGLGMGGVEASARMEWVADESQADDERKDSSSSRKSYCVATKRFEEFKVRSRQDLSASEPLGGPAIIQEPSSTILVFSDQQVVVDGHGNLVISEA